MKRGFTLVELMATIIILGLIVGISFPIIGSTVKNSKEKILQQNIKNLENAARIYLTNNDSEFIPIEQIITLNELKQSGLLGKEIINPIDKKEIVGCIKYKWNKEYKEYEVRFSNDCSNNGENENSHGN